MMGVESCGPWRILATSPGANWDIEEEATRAVGDAAEFVTGNYATPEELIAAARDADGLIAGNEQYTRHTLEQLGRAR